MLFFSWRYIKRFDYGVMLISLGLMSNIMCAMLNHSVVSTLCNPVDCSLPRSSVHGILQAKILEWVAMPSSRGSSQLRDQTQASHIAGRFFTCNGLSHMGHPELYIYMFVILLLFF